MRLYIHTAGRAEKQTTLNLLPERLQARTTLVVQAQEAAAYRAHAPWPYRANDMLVLPKHIQTLSPTRQYILDHHNVKKHGPKLVLLDDDLRFDKRRMDMKGLFQVGTDADVLAIFKKLELALDYFAHAGVLAREGGNRVEESYRLATRMTRILAYDVTEVRKAKARFDRVPCKQDFDMTLQLLRAGYPNYVICDYVQGQGGSQAIGGCSTYRTLKMLHATAGMLKKLHPEFVNVVRKETRSAWGGTKENPVERTEVVVQWKKALESSGIKLPTKMPARLS
jgi:hypothetical protein